MRAKPSSVQGLVLGGCGFGWAARELSTEGFGGFPKQEDTGVKGSRTLGWMTLGAWNQVRSFCLNR